MNTATATVITVDTTGVTYASTESAAAQLNPGTYSATYLNGVTGAKWIGNLVVVSPTFAHFAPIRRA